jgi:arylformamidase
MMRAWIEWRGKQYVADLSKPADLSVAMHPDGPRAWYVGPVSIEPVRMPGFVGAVAEGGSVNFRNILFNPHGHGTHTESVGHITRDVWSVNRTLRKAFFVTSIITVTPRHIDQDLVITEDMLAAVLPEYCPEAVIIRTLPNDVSKLSRLYSGTNFPYLHVDAMRLLVSRGVDHLLIDLPSVDREEDGGALAAHRAFWLEAADRTHCTISEMVFVPDEVNDGLYLMNLQTAAFENDATPSRPVVFALKESIQGTAGSEK